MRKKSRTIKINLSISNRLLYSIIALLLVIGIGVGVYAYGTSNPSVFGHTISEIKEKVCYQSDTGTWINCPANNGNDPRFSIKGNQLCFNVDSGCATQTPLCTKTEILIDDVYDCNGVAQNTLNSRCSIFCKTQKACDGNALSQCQGGTSLNYARGVFLSCPILPGSNPVEHILKCVCSISNGIYTKETLGGERCI